MICQQFWLVFTMHEKLDYFVTGITSYLLKLFPPGGGVSSVVTSGWSNHLPSRITSPLEDAAGLDASSCCKWNDSAEEYAYLWSARYLSGATKYTSSEPAVSTFNDPLWKGIRT